MELKLIFGWLKIFTKNNTPHKCWYTYSKGPLFWPLNTKTDPLLRPSMINKKPSQFQCIQVSLLALTHYKDHCSQYRGSQYKGYQYRGSQIQRVSMQRISMQRVSMQRVSMQRVSIQRVSIQRVSIQRVSIQRVSIQTVSIQRVSIQRVFIQRVVLLAELHFITLFQGRI